MIQQDGSDFTQLVLSDWLEENGHALEAEEMRAVDPEIPWAWEFHSHIGRYVGGGGIVGSRVGNGDVGAINEHFSVGGVGGDYDGNFVGGYENHSEVGSG